MPDWLMSTKGPQSTSKSGFSSAALARSSASGTYCSESLVVYLRSKRVQRLHHTWVQRRARTHGPAATRACTPGPLAVRRSAAGSGMPSTTRDALTVFSPPRDCEQMTCK